MTQPLWMMSSALELRSLKYLILPFGVVPLLMAAYHLRQGRWGIGLSFIAPAALYILIADSDAKLATATALTTLLAVSVSAYLGRYKLGLATELQTTGFLATAGSVVTGLVNFDYWHLRLPGFDAPKSGLLVGGTVALLLMFSFGRLRASRTHRN